jgi:DNA-binding winged helix-turn-helix (wHTH) protein/tetratricopeptide (TPR) repeat protein
MPFEHTASFGPFRFDLSIRELRKHGTRLRLEEKPAQVLQRLLENAGAVVSRQELHKLLWPDGIHVDFDHGLDKSINRLRAVLGDDCDQPRYIETLSRRGYRFVARVDFISPAEAATVLEPGFRQIRELAAPEVATVARNRRIPWVTGALGVTVAAVLVGYFPLHRPAKLADKDTIVIADFANSTGDAVFNDTLKQGLSIGLRQSPFLNLLSDDKVGTTLELMNRSPQTQLSPEVTREICQRTNSKVYVAGSISLLGTEYVLGLKAVNCANGETLAQEQTTAPTKETVLNALGDAAVRLRGELGESRSTVKTFDIPLEQATTPSLEALKAYSHRDYERAIQLDPSFALAYWMAGSMSFDRNKRSEYLTKAFQLRDHASQREKLTIQGGYYEHVTGELDKAAQALEAVVKSYPRLPEFESRDVSPHVMLGDVYMSQGRYADAQEVTRESLRYVPHHAPPYINLAQSLIALQRFDEARATLQKVPTTRMDMFSEDIHMYLYALAFVSADDRALSREQQWFESKPTSESVGFSLASDTMAYAGHLGRAREFTKRSVNSASGEDDKEDAALWEENSALREAAFGNVGEARQAASDGLRLAPENAGVEFAAALAFAMIGDSEQVKPLGKDLNTRFPLDTRMQTVWLPTIQAQSALVSNRPTEAIAQLQTAKHLEMGNGMSINQISCLYPAYIRGEAYLATGQGKEAAAEFQKILDHSGIVWNCWTGALAHLGVARADGLGAKTSQGADADAARVRALSAYKDFFALWNDADPDIPILKQAKAEYTKLQ